MSIHDMCRALLRDPSLILCDEITSSVDAFAERDIVESLRQASERRTTVTVAHRLSSITHCDAIIVMDKGRVVEKGTHHELLQRPSGLYRRMWEAQNEAKVPLVVTEDDVGPIAEFELSTSVAAGVSTTSPFGGTDHNTTLD